jgi:exodeoxyribonuclease VII large subunit
VILLARGGGSIEDLWAFNEEIVVRAVIESAAPVITGVGHETDFTLADFAADLRAPTPTAAAELATPITILDLKADLLKSASILSRQMMACIQREHDSVARMESRQKLASPGRKLQNERQRLDEISRRLNAAQAYRIRITSERFKGLENRLLALNPKAVLGRGYAIVTKNEKVVSNVAQVRKDDELQVHVQDGKFDARVTGNG